MLFSGKQRNQTQWPLQMEVTAPSCTRVLQDLSSPLKDLLFKHITKQSPVSYGSFNLHWRPWLLSCLHVLNNSWQHLTLFS